VIAAGVVDVEACHDAWRTVVRATQDMRLARPADRIVHLHDGRITSEVRPTAENVVAERAPAAIGSLLEVGPAGLADLADGYEELTEELFDEDPDLRIDR